MGGRSCGQSEGKGELATVKWFAVFMLVVGLFNAIVEARTGKCNIPSWWLHLEVAVLWGYMAATKFEASESDPKAKGN
jgi:hypothetical protein